MLKEFYHFPSLKEIQSLVQPIKGLFFDMDGTLLPTENIHEKVFLKMAQTHQVQIPHNATGKHQMKGFTDQQVYDIAKNWVGFPFQSSEEFIQEKNQQVLEIISSLKAENFIPSGFSLFMEEAQKLNMRTALVTSSEKKITEALFKQFSLHQYFECILTLQDVNRPKPDPDPYQIALKKLSLSPKETIIFEDSEVGLMAAKAAGAHVIKANWWPNP